MTDVRLEALSKCFGTANAVQRCDLHVASGQCTVLVGPSGCGKTTLLRLIAGLETPSSGTIHIGGRDVAGVSPRDRGVAMVLQDCAVYRHMTVRGNLRYPLAQRRTAGLAASLVSSSCTHPPPAGDGPHRTTRRRRFGHVGARRPHGSSA